MSTPTDLLKRFLRFPADALIASSKKLPNKVSESVMRDPHLSDKFYPWEADQIFFIVPKPSIQHREPVDRRELPVPPRSLWGGFSSERRADEYFLHSGKVHFDKMKTILYESGFRIEDKDRILDFGCSSGRIIRWFVDYTEHCEVWGVDINAREIIWCQQNLSPPFKFATVTTSPHLPFEDNYFDLIYCVSVFTHIADLADAWLLELKRITRPQGRLFITVLDKHTADVTINQPEKILDTGIRVPEERRDWLLSWDREHKFSALDYDMFTIGRGPESNVFYDINYLQEHWGRIFKIRSITLEGSGYQTALVLEK